MHTGTGFTTGQMHTGTGSALVIIKNITVTIIFVASRSGENCFLGGFRSVCVAICCAMYRNLHMQSCIIPPMIFDCCSIAFSVRPNVNNLCSVIVGSLNPLSCTFDIAQLWIICNFTSLSFSCKLQWFVSGCNRALYWSRVSAAICSACRNLKISYSSLHSGVKYAVSFRFVSAKLSFSVTQLCHSIQTQPHQRNAVSNTAHSIVILNVFSNDIVLEMMLPELACAVRWLQRKTAMSATVSIFTQKY